METILIGGGGGGGGYSILRYAFRVTFTNFVDSVVFFTFTETCSHWFYRLLGWYLQRNIRLMHCKVFLYCIWEGFEATVIIRGYSDSIVVLLIDLLSTKAEPAWNRSLTSFLESTVMQSTGFNVKISHQNFLVYPNFCFIAAFFKW